MRKIIFLLLSSVLITSSAYAGGSIFGHHKTKNANPYGVYSIGVHICSDLECPPIRIVTGKCEGAHMTKHWGVCVCDEGYVAKDGLCEQCPEGQYSDGVHECTDCAPGTYKVHPDDTSCTPCPQGSYCINGQKYDCPEHATACDNEGKATACEEGYEISGNACVCGEGKYVDEEGVCRNCPVQECPADNECCTLTGPNDVCGNPTPELGLKDYNGDCHSCNEINTVYMGYPEECAKCPNRELLLVPYCELSCGDDEFRGSDRNCHSCNENSPIQPFNESECAKCANRGYYRDGYCYPTKCDGFRDYAGDCHSCDDPDPISTTNEDCAICTNREDYAGYCYPTKCGGFRDQGGNCYSCDEPNPIQTDECGKCTNRFLSNNSITCVLCPDTHATACENYTGASTACEEGYEVKDGACVEKSTDPTCPGNSSATEITNGTSFEVTEGTESITCWCPEGQSYQSTGCANAPIDCNDYEHNVCGLGYYCQTNNIPSCTAGGNGTCTKISSSNGNAGTKTTGGYWVRNEYMDWFSANSWCIGKGRSGLIRLSSLNIALPDNKFAGHCDFPDGVFYEGELEIEACKTVDGVKMILDNDYAHYWATLQGKIGSENYWTGDMWPSTSCDVWYLRLDSGRVDGSSRDFSGYYALCE